MKEGILMAVSTTLKQIRTERNICQEDLAVAIGSCGRTIGRIERGERNASLELALRISRYLGISVEELFSLEDE
jgi:putative transcriptional regulator